jgi:hypothetical protein
VEHTTGFRLNNNSLYPALRRFEEAGAVTSAEEPQEGQRAVRGGCLLGGETVDEGKHRTPFGKI